MPTEGASEAFEHATLHYPTIRDIADEELGLQVIRDLLHGYWYDHELRCHRCTYHIVPHALLRPPSHCGILFRD